MHGNRTCASIFQNDFSANKKGGAVAGQSYVCIHKERGLQRKREREKEGIGIRGDLAARGEQISAVSLAESGSWTRFPIAGQRRWRTKEARWQRSAGDLAWGWGRLGGGGIRLESRNFCNKAGPSISPLYKPRTPLPPRRTTGLLDRRDERAALPRTLPTNAVYSNFEHQLYLSYLFISLLPTSSRVTFFPPLLLWQKEGREGWKVKFLNLSIETIESKLLANFRLIRIRMRWRGREGEEELSISLRIILSEDRQSLGCFRSSLVHHTDLITDRGNEHRGE